MWTVDRCIVILESGCCCLFVPLFFIFLSLQFSNIKIFQSFSSHFSQGLWGLEGWNLVHMWPMGGCIVYTEIMLLLLFVPLFFFIFLSLQFSSIKNFCQFSWKLWGLEGWNFLQTWTVVSYIVYTEIRMLLLIHPFSSSFFFLSSFQISNIFVAPFSGTVRPRILKLVTHVNHGWMYRVYPNQTAAPYLFLYFFLPLQFSNIKNFVALLSGIAKQYKHEE